LPIHSSSSSSCCCCSGGVKAWLRGPLGRVPAPAASQRGYFGRHLAIRNEMRVSGSDSLIRVAVLVAAIVQSKRQTNMYLLILHGCSESVLVHHSERHHKMLEKYLETRQSANLRSEVAILDFVQRHNSRQNYFWYANVSELVKIS